jgi:hypothetical protein
MEGIDPSAIAIIDQRAATCKQKRARDDDVGAPVSPPALPQTKTRARADDVPPTIPKTADRRVLRPDGAFISSLRRFAPI